MNSPVRLVNSNWCLQFDTYCICKILVSPLILSVYELSQVCASVYAYCFRMWTQEIRIDFSHMAFDTLRCDVYHRYAFRATNWQVKSSVYAWTSLLPCCSFDHDMENIVYSYFDFSRHQDIARSPDRSWSTTRNCSATAWCNCSCFWWRRSSFAKDCQGNPRNC